MIEKIEIPLFNGKITGKSQLNFKKFVSLMETNLQYSLLITLLQEVGLGIELQKEFLEIQNESQEKTQKLIEWLCYKEAYKLEKKIALAKEL